MIGAGLWIVLAVLMGLPVTCLNNDTGLFCKLMYNILRFPAAYFVHSTGSLLDLSAGLVGFIIQVLFWGIVGQIYFVKYSHKRRN